MVETFNVELGRGELTLPCIYEPIKYLNTGQGRFCCVVPLKVLERVHTRDLPTHVLEDLAILVPSTGPRTVRVKAHARPEVRIVGPLCKRAPDVGPTSRERACHQDELRTRLTRLETRNLTWDHVFTEHVTSVELSVYSYTMPKSAGIGAGTTGFGLFLHSVTLVL